MCQHEGSLDYIISKHTETGELRIIRLAEDSEDPTVMNIFDYKTVDKDPLLELRDEIHVDCKRDGEFGGASTYIIGVAGTYFHDNGLSSYYLAKFSTQFNMTEYFIKSDDDTVMEQVKGVRVDIDSEMLYVSVEINKNTYHGMTVFEPGSKPEPDNSNIAIIGYTWSFGVRLWVVVGGNEKFQDKFVNMEPWGSHLYVTLNSYSTEYSTNSS
jgi:hypothetical protein